jgi:photosystem II stability/assembly factor-like uncharacterized protein
MKNFVNSVKTKLLFLLFAGICLQTKAQWYMIAQSNDSTSCGWEDVFFLNNDTGFVVGCIWPMPYTFPPSAILRTHNGGLTWDTTLFISTNLEPHQIMAIHCPNDTVCYAVGFKGRLYKTSDGGDTWTWSNPPIFAVNGDSPATLEDVFFFDSDTGFVCNAYAHGQLIAQTNDGGSTWDVDTFCIGSKQFSFPDRKIGWTNYGCRTQNGGNTWKFFNSYAHINHPQFNSPISTSFLDSQFGFIAGIGSNGFNYGYDVYNFGVVARTKDGSNSWECKDFPTIRYIATIQMLNNNIGYFGGAPNYHLRYIFKTENGGDNWYPQELVGKNILNYYPDIFSIHCPNDSVCYAVGRYQYIYKTTNGGGPLIGVGIKENKEEKAFTVYPNPANNLLTIKWSEELAYPVELRISDVSGRIVMQQQITNATQELQLNIAALENGLYLLKLQTEQGTQTAKIVKQ